MVIIDVNIYCVTVFKIFVRLYFRLKRDFRIQLIVINQTDNSESGRKENDSSLATWAANQMKCTVLYTTDIHNVYLGIGHDRITAWVNNVYLPLLTRYECKQI